MAAAAAEAMAALAAAAVAAAAADAAPAAAEDDCLVWLCERTVPRDSRASKVSEGMSRR